MKQQSKAGFGLLVVAVAAVAFGGSFASFSSMATTQSSSMDTSLIKGHTELVHRSGETGAIIAYSQSDNFITDDGLQVLANVMFGSNSTSSANVTLSHIEVGEGTGGGVANSDLATVTAPACARVPITATSPDAASGSLQVTVTAQIDAAADANCAGISLTEAGLFNDLSAGMLFAINDFTTGVTLQGTDTLDITWTFDFSDT